MNIAYTMGPGRGDTDALLFTVARDLEALGYVTCGIVQVNTNCGPLPCDMDVHVLPDGPVLRISQSLGPAARGCRLDPASLETAVGLVEKRLQPDLPDTADVDVLIINKFGKHEAEGRGFRGTIAQAIASDIPVLVGLNALNAEAFHDFTDGEAMEIQPSADALIAWLRSVARGHPERA